MSKKVIMYGTPSCPDCVVLKDLFDAEGVHYGYVDILEGLGHLKKFLNVRDSHADVFKKITDALKIGIPAVVVDDADVYAELKPTDDGFDIAKFK